jgi:hypothetical protein
LKEKQLMKRIRKSCLAASLLAALAASCTLTHAAPVKKAPAKKAPAKKAPAQKIPALKARPNYVVGRVTDAAGQPVAGAEVAIYGTTMAGANTRFEAKTDARGLFSQRVPEGIYGVTAYLKKRFNDKNYKFTLPPTDGITAMKHDSSKGIVKNFVWRIRGLKPGETPGEAGTHTEPRKYFGGFVYLRSEEKGFGGDRVYFPAGSTLKITLTPRGPLMDGSKGQAKTFQRRFDKDVTNGISWYLTDIPIGLYTLSAQLSAPGGEIKTLGVKNVTSGFKDEFAPTAPINFEPTSYEDMQMMQVIVQP